MTVTDLIIRAMNDLGLIQEGEVPTPDQLLIGYSALNDWIDGLAPDFQTVYAITRTTWTLTTATSYTVGSGGDINIARPINADAIENIGYVDNAVSPAFEVQQGPCLTEDAYAAIPVKTLTSPLPQVWYYSPTFALGTLKPFPVPSQSNLLGVLYARTAVSEFTSLTQTVSVPNGYRRFFRSNLAMEIAAAFNADPSPALVQTATDSAMKIRTGNVRPSDLRSDAAGLFGPRRFYNIYTS